MPGLGALATALIIAPPDKTPAGSPSPPVWATPFTPVFGALQGGAPSLGPMTRNAQNGDAVNLGGAFASNCTFETYTQTSSLNGMRLSSTVRRAISNRAMLSVNASAAPNSLTLIYAKDSTGRYSLPAICNLPQIWFLDGSTTGNNNIIVGDTVSTFGQNLSANLVYTPSVGYDTSSPGTKCDFWVKTTFDAGQHVACTSVNPYRANFVMPPVFAQSTSATNLPFQTGTTTTINTQAGLNYPFGLPVVMHSALGFMVGTVAAYGGTTLILTITFVDPYAAGQSTGGWTIDPYYDAQVSVHTGRGDKYGWSDPIPLHINSRTGLGIDYTRQTFNLPGPTGVNATDEANLTAAIAAIDTSGTPGGPATIVAQAGTYKLSHDFGLNSGFSRGIKLVGQGAGITIFQATAGFASASDGRIFHSTGVGELNSLTVDCSLAAANPASTSVPRYVNANLFYPYPAGIGANGFFSCRNVRVESGGNVYMSGCNVTGMGVGENNAGAVAPSFMYIDSCNFYGTLATDSLIGTWGGSNFHITNNTGGHYLPAGTINDKGGGRFVFLAVTNYGSCRNGYIAGNTTPVRFDNPNSATDGELFGSEGPYGTDVSLATAATANTVTTTNAPSGGWTSTPNSRDVAITGGKGEGQVRQIVSISGSQYTVDRDWDLIPDTTSEISIVAGYSRFIYYANTVKGGNVLSDGTRQNDSQGFSLYGGLSDIIIDGNAVSDCNYGISEWLNNNAFGVPLFYTLFQNNTFDHCNTGIRTRMLYGGPPETALFLGNLHRNETFTNLVLAPWELQGTIIDLYAMQNCAFSGSGALYLYGITNPLNNPLINVAAGTVNANLIDTSIRGADVLLSQGENLGTGYNILLHGSSSLSHWASGDAP